MKVTIQIQWQEKISDLMTSPGSYVPIAILSHQRNEFFNELEARGYNSGLDRQLSHESFTGPRKKMKIVSGA